MTVFSYATNNSLMGLALLLLLVPASVRGQDTVSSSWYDAAILLVITRIHEYMPITALPSSPPASSFPSRTHNWYAIVTFSSFTLCISIAAITHRTSRNSANYPLAIDMWGSSVVLRCQCECLRARYEFCSRNIVCHFRGLLQCYLLFIQWWVYHLWWMQ